MEMQKKTITTIIFIVLIGLTISTKALTSQKQGVAKVIVMRGTIKAKLPTGKLVDVTKGMWLKEGSIIQSAPKSFCRLLFIDKSTMNLGADSQMVIDKFPESDAGIITLMKGQVRSKVTKDYMNIKDKDKSKLFIKTKTAAMGVRGTDFQVNYNSRNTNTSLITFSGAVAMARLDERDPASTRFNHNRLEQIVSGREAVIVREGELSAITKGSSRATIPQKLGRSQLDGLKDQSPDQSNNSTKKKNNKKFRNPVPPGVDAKKFANDSKETVKESIGTSLGTEIKSDASVRSPASTSQRSSTPSEGLHNPSTGEYAPPAGSVLDLKTVNIVEPPKGSVYDPITETYIIPPELGSVNPDTGEYVPPEGMVLTDNGTLEAQSNLTRAPASKGAQNQSSPGVKVNSIATDEQNQETLAQGTGNENFGTGSNTNEYQRLTEETLSENEDQLEDQIEQELIENNRGKASFEFSRVD